jgi:hypothetical protein
MREDIRRIHAEIFEPWFYSDQSIRGDAVFTELIDRHSFPLSIPLYVRKYILTADRAFLHPHS